MIRVVPYDCIETFAVQEWLDNQAKNGWQLKRLRSLTASFTKSEPRCTRYRLDPLTAEKYDDEILEAYADQGWNYVCDSGGNRFRVFRSDDPDIPELHTDQEVLWRAMRGGIIGNAVGLVVFLLLMLYLLFRPNGWLAVFFMDSPLLQILTDNAIYLVLGMLFLLMFWILYGIVFLGAARRAYRDLKQGYAGKRPSDRRCQIRLLVLFLLFLGVVIMGFVKTGQSADHFRSPDAGMPLPGWEDVAPEEFRLSMENIDPQEKMMQRFAFDSYSPFAEKIERQREKGKTNGLFYDADCYRMKSEALAQKVFSLLCEKYQASVISDGTAFGTKYGSQNLIMRSGNTVIWISYNGEADLVQAQPLYEAVLNGE